MANPNHATNSLIPSEVEGSWLQAIDVVGQSQDPSFSI
jgi:hypothetical protein